MDEILRYKILYTQTAAKDLEDKADYIAFRLQDPVLAQRWYLRLRELIQDGLTTFPLKYPLYDVEPWREKGIRLFLTRSDVVMNRPCTSGESAREAGTCPPIWRKRNSELSQ